MTNRLQLENVSVAFGDTIVVREVSLRLPEGEIGCLLGPSGCGKTTLLRAVAGFESIGSGEIHLHGQRVSTRGHTLAPEKRRVGMVFQDFALFPHLTIADNIRFGIRGLSRALQSERIGSLLKLIGLDTIGASYPHQLSGGQQQRVAIARALAPRPEILLLDEPFSSMDADLRVQLAAEVRDVLKQENMTAILVTHDQHEAFAMADEIGVMNLGRIEQWDSAYNLYHRPDSRFVAGFIGLGVMLPGKVVGADTVETELGRIGGRIDDSFAAGESVDLLVRPDDIIHSDDSNLTAVVTEKHFRGAEFLYHLRLPGGQKLLCFAPSHHDHRIGEPIGITSEIEHLVMFKSRT
ncbi:MAG: ABC transporter ATP-binding protein [Pseudomonadota bacterium]|nr:ABC transporter ATP-binding protein [Pseudomonadota bacterium]